MLLLPSGLWFFTVWWILGVVKKQTISSLNDLSIVFESPSSVKHCKVGTLHGGRGSCYQEPLGIMGWPSECHIMMSCVCWGVAPAGFASGRGYLTTGAPICLERSPSDMIPDFIRLFFFSSFFSQFAREGLCTNYQKVNFVQCYTICPKH